MALNLKDYSISEKTGFAMEDPLDKLPAEFEEWNELAATMPKLVAEGTMRERVRKMPLLDWKKLMDERQQRLAHLQLAIITAGYVWQDGEQNAAKVLPKCVAVPLWRLSEHLRLKPIITYADLILANYRPINPTKPLDLVNLSSFYRLPGEDEAEWFIVIHVAIELAFAKAFKPVLDAIEGVKSKDEGKVITSLKAVAGVVDDMLKNFKRIHENLTTNTFFNTMRAFASGWGGEGNPLPDGLIYEGISDQPETAIGGSAAQSGTVQVVDALLGVQHNEDKKEFLRKMRGYMVRGHERFIEDVAKQSKDLRTMVQSSANAELRKTYDHLLAVLEQFRSYHIQIVTKYIVQAKKSQNDFESLNERGTGGTNLIPFLQDLRDTTKGHRVTETE